jgi:hypothetical protein
MKANRIPRDIIEPQLQVRASVGHARKQKETTCTYINMTGTHINKTVLRIAHNNTEHDVTLAVLGPHTKMRKYY